MCSPSVAYKLPCSGVHYIFTATVTEQSSEGPSFNCNYGPTGVRLWRGGSDEPTPHQLESLGERCKFPHWGLGSPKVFGHGYYYYCTIIQLSPVGDSCIIFLPYFLCCPARGPQRSSGARFIKRFKPRFLRHMQSDDAIRRYNTSAKERLLLPCSEMHFLPRDELSVCLSDCRDVGGSGSCT